MTYQRNETPEPLAQGQAGEMPVVAWLPSRNLRYLKERTRKSVSAFPYKVDSDEQAVVLLSDATAALQAKDAEIARLKADAGRWDFVRHHWTNVQMHWNKDATNSLKSMTLTIKTANWTIAADEIESQIDAAIRTQTGGEQ